MPMIASLSRGPKEVDRHWDYKARSGSDIIVPVEPKFNGREIDFVVFDEISEVDKDTWKADLVSEYAKTKEKHSVETLEGSFAALSEKTEETTTLTADKLRKAMELLDEGDMARKKKIPKKKKARTDSRKANYSGEMFGNILFSTTEQIEGNTTLNDALYPDNKDMAMAVEALIIPLFDEFFQARGKDWQVIEPMTLAAQSVESGKWKSVSALGGEILHYHSVVIGKRDGICIKWTTGNIVGLDEEMMVDTTIKAFGKKMVSAILEGNESNPANRKVIIDELLEFAGKSNIVTAANEAKERTRLAIAAQLKKDIERKSEAYGESFGSWA